MLETGNAIKGNAAGFVSEIQEQKRFQKCQGAKLLPSLLVLTVASIFWMMAPPEGLTTQTWHLMIIFLVTTLCVSTKTLTLDQTLTTFSSGVV